MSSLKVVHVSYTHDDVFCIPKNIDLEDKTQVENWGVKYNTLYIYLVNGKTLKIESKGWIHDFDYKYPISTSIENADEFGIDDDDIDEEEEEEEEIEICHGCKNAPDDDGLHCDGENWFCGKCWNK